MFVRGRVPLPSCLSLSLSLFVYHSFFVSFSVRPFQCVCIMHAFFLCACVQVCVRASWRPSVVRRAWTENAVQVQSVTHGRIAWGEHRNVICAGNFTMCRSSCPSVFVPCLGFFVPHALFLSSEEERESEMRSLRGCKNNVYECDIVYTIWVERRCYSVRKTVGLGGVQRWWSHISQPGSKGSIMRWITLLKLRRHWERVTRLVWFDRHDVIWGLLLCQTTE